jgi:hypothetical protein
VGDEFVAGVVAGLAGVGELHPAGGDEPTISRLKDPSIAATAAKAQQEPQSPASVTFNGSSPSSNSVRTGTHLP